MVVFQVVYEVLYTLYIYRLLYVIYLPTLLTVQYVCVYIYFLNYEYCGNVVLYSIVFFCCVCGLWSAGAETESRQVKAMGSAGGS